MIIMVRACCGYGSLWGGRSNLRQGVAGISVAAKAVDAYWCGSKSKSNICGGSKNYSLGFWVTRKSWCGTSRTSSSLVRIIVRYTAGWCVCNTSRIHGGVTRGHDEESDRGKITYGTYCSLQS